MRHLHKGYIVVARGKPVASVNEQTLGFGGRTGGVACEAVWRFGASYGLLNQAVDDPAPVISWAAGTVTVFN